MTKFITCFGFAVITCGISGDASAQHLPGPVTTESYMPNAKPNQKCDSTQGKGVIGVCLEKITCNVSGPGGSFDVAACTRILSLNEILTNDFTSLSERLDKHDLSLGGKANNEYIKSLEDKITTNGNDIKNMEKELLEKINILEGRIDELKHPP